jgi:predicted metalloprotease
VAIGGGGLITVVIALVALLLGVDPFGGSGGGLGIPDIGAVAPPARQGSAPDPDAATKTFASAVFDDAQVFWTDLFQRGGRSYEEATLVLYDQPIDTGGCGAADPRVGPFYCPADESMYLELGFFRQLEQQFGAPGDFAQAYVIAHEVGHHVQKLLGVEEQFRREQSDDPARANDLSVRFELQADCLAGVWGHSTYERGLLDPGEVQEALDAAAAVGDDRLGARSPESWTHGSSALRQKWFQRGFDSGDPNACDTFSGSV